MSKKRERQADSVEGLAEWGEHMSRHLYELSREADTNRRRRTLEFRGKQHARIATVLRELVRAAESLAP